jgi:endonuclease YncB( thermonuclease family)
MKTLWLFFFLFVSGAVSAAEMVGQGRYVADGDTFDLSVSGRILKVRICGIDAPKSGEPGSKEAWAKLSELVHGKTVSCIQVNSPPGTVCDGRSKSKNRDRIVAQCFVNGRDIAADLVQAGVACDWPKFSGGHYQRVPGARACTR